NAEALAQRPDQEQLRELIGEMDAVVRHEPHEVDILQVAVTEPARTQVLLDARARDDQRQHAAVAAIPPIRANQPLAVAAGVWREVLVSAVQRARQREYE